MTSKHAMALLLGATTSCATNQGPATPPSPTPAQTPTPPADAPKGEPSHIHDNLGKLQALQVFEVGTLVVDAPEGAYSCYGVCPQHREAVTAAEQKAAGRLERLVAAATTAAPDSSPGTCERAAIDRNLAALNELKIVAVMGFIEDKPVAKPSCYNEVCPGEAEAAKQKNCERAARLAGIAAAAKGL